MSLGLLDWLLWRKAVQDTPIEFGCGPTAELRMAAIQHARSCLCLDKSLIEMPSSESRLLEMQSAVTREAAR